LQTHANVTRSVLQERIDAFRKCLIDSLPKSHQKEIGRIAEYVIDEFDKSVNAPAVRPIHALSESESRRVVDLLTARANSSREECIQLVRQLENVEDQLADLNLQLVRAPAESTLRAEFDALTQAGIDLGRLQQEKANLVEDLRRQTWHCIDVTRKLRGLEEQASLTWSADQAELRATAIRDLMSEYSKEITRFKLGELKRHFVDTFGRLARKEDLVIGAEIDEEDFSVTLIDRRGARIPKESLSAGERQIYAIAMLEALAKTSRRSLPVIIDTPLGRLDSKHRQKLVEQYFPLASHQVIVLSTDTEVDEPFYQGLAKHVSHAYHLVFDEKAGATSVEKGYFWKHLDEEMKDVA
jgi:DNA sulfur modification protein DndD